MQSLAVGITDCKSCCLNVNLDGNKNTLTHCTLYSNVADPVPFLPNPAFFYFMQKNIFYGVFLLYEKSSET